MKKLILTLLATCIATGVWAQSVNVTKGKQLYEAERYEQALPYLQKAVEEGDIDSKARMATMIFTQPFMDMEGIGQEGALAMLDECIAAGSVYAMERKGFCNLLMGKDTKADKLAAIELLRQASEKGSGDASAELFNVYRHGLKSYADGEEYIAINDSLATQFAHTAAEQGNIEGLAYVGWYTYSGTHGYEKDVATGVQLMEEADRNNRRLFTTNCLEPAKALCAHYKAQGQNAKATPIMTLLKKYHPTEF